MAPIRYIIPLAPLTGAVALSAPLAASHGVAFIPHMTAPRVALVDGASAVVGLALFGASAVILRRRQGGGKALLMLRQAPYAWLYGALAAVFVAICCARLLDPRLRQPSALALNVGWVAFCLAYIANRPQVRERGLVVGARFLPWARIASYEARDASGKVKGDALLTIAYYPSRGAMAEPCATTIRCSARKRPEIELLLARYVRTEQGHRRWHARRVATSEPASATPGRDYDRRPVHA